jgi:hypothetical protein
MLCQLDALLDRLPHIILFQALSYRLSLRGVVSLRMHSLPYRTPFDPFALVVDCSFFFEGFGVFGGVSCFASFGFRFGEAIFVGAFSFIALEGFFITTFSS